MSRVYSTGFELNSTTTGMEADTFSSVTVSTTNVRTGTYALRANTGGGFWRTQVYAADSSTAIGYCRFYLYIATTPSTATQVFRFATAANSPQIDIELTTGNQLRLLNGLAVQIGSNSSTLSTATWYRIEVSHNPANGADAAYVDGVSFASGTGTTGSWSRVLLGSITGTPTIDLYFDDVAVNDNSGSFQTGLPGAGKIICLRPNAAGDSNTYATATGGTAGTANNYTRVNEVTPNDTTSFNQATALNQVDMFNVDNSGIGASDTVNVVSVGLRLADSTGGASATTAVTPQIEKTASGTTATGTAIIPNSTTFVTNAAGTPHNYPLTTYQDPDGSAWTQTTLDSMQIGYKETAFATNHSRVSAVWALVDYTPSVGGTTGQAKVYNGSSFVAKPVKVWNGSAWVIKPLKRYNGSSWVVTPY